jgi:predicted esterase
MRSSNLLRFVLLLVCGILVGVLGYFLIFHGQELWLALMIDRRMTDRGDELVYVPGGAASGVKDTAGSKYPLVFALSPSADAYSMITKWQAVAEKHSWIVAASKTSRNGVDFTILLPQIEAEIKDVLANYPVDPARVIFTGMSGGGMAAYWVAATYPNQAWGLVINTGMMYDATGGAVMRSPFPHGKVAVLLASPTDFRYNEMKRDRDFLISYGWTVRWIDFDGGHTVAPDSVYEEAAQWLESH